MRDYFKKFIDGIGGAFVNEHDMWSTFCQRYGVCRPQSEAAEKYLEGVVRHKVEVYKAGIEISGKFGFDDFTHSQFQSRLFWHDLSKFSESEVMGYSAYNFNGSNSIPVKAAFERAWNHHKNMNDHHPEFWLSVNRNGTTEPLEMDILAVYEMVADWIGAGRTYGNELRDWLPKNVHTFAFHPDTCYLLERILDGLGFAVRVVDNSVCTSIVCDGTK